MESLSLKALKERVDVALRDMALSGHKHGLMAEQMILAVFPTLMIPFSDSCLSDTILPPKFLISFIKSMESYPSATLPF